MYCTVFNTVLSQHHISIAIILMVGMLEMIKKITRNKDEIRTFWDQKQSNDRSFGHDKS